MADYHIYLHGEGNGSSSNKTTPFSAKQENESTGIFQTAAASKAFSTAKTVASGGAVSTGVAALAKVFPWIAAVIAVAKITDHVISTGFAHQEEYTGNYANNMNYNNFKTLMSSYFHPVKAQLAYIHQQKQFEKQNKAIAQQNRLIGNSILKDFNIGV